MHLLIKQVGRMSCAYSRQTGDTAEVDRGEVEALIRRRSTLRDQGDYAAADAILRSLNNDLKVDLDDRTKTWKVRNVAGVLAIVASRCQNNSSEFVVVYTGQGRRRAS